MVLEERVLHLILEYIRAGGYDGPVSMAWDDTKLHATLRAYWDPLLKAHFLVGHAGRPIQLASAEELQEILQSKSKEPGTKVCVRYSELIHTLVNCIFAVRPSLIDALSASYA